MKITAWFTLLFLSLPLLAQNNLQANVNHQFRFANPGARAQAMGGAFIGLADDTTAIFANPAGLVQMRSDTLIVEANHTSNDNLIPFYAGTIRQDNLQDFAFELEERNFPVDTTSIPFAAYVRAKGKLKWGIFYSEQANVDKTFETNGIAIPLGPRDVTNFDLTFFPPSDNHLSTKLRSLGVSLAGNLHPKVSAGFTISYQQMDYASSGIFRIPNLEEFFPDVPFTPRTLEQIRPLYGQDFAETYIAGEDEDIAVYAGLLFMPSERFSIGLAYKRQGGFGYDYNGRDRDDDFEWNEPLIGSGTFQVPHSYGAGLAFKPNDSNTLTIEVNRVLYSTLSDDFVAIFRSQNDPVEANQTAPDVTEIHVGYEYIYLGAATPISFRFGYWLEPYHALTNDVLDTQILFRYQADTGNYIQDSRGSAFLQRFARDLNHITAGIGFTLGQKFTLDLSADIDDENASYSLSSIYRF